MYSNGTETKQIEIELIDLLLNAYHANIVFLYLYVSLLIYIILSNN